MLKKYIKINYAYILCVFLNACASRTAPPAPIINVTANGNNSVSADTGIVVNKKKINTTSPADEMVNSLNAKPDVSIQTNYAKSDEMQQSNNSDNNISTKLVPHKTNLSNKDSGTNNKENNELIKWIMPTIGEVINEFSLKTRGIDLKGSVGQPIYAVADGKVLYSGHQVSSYGNLIIIKHSNNYLSAYAQNKTNLVNKGDTVKRGTIIANMGSDVNSKHGILHFEIRQFGKPIDPMLLIK